MREITMVLEASALPARPLRGSASSPPTRPTSLVTHAPTFCPDSGGPLNGTPLNGKRPVGISLALATVFMVGSAAVALGTFGDGTRRCAGGSVTDGGG